LCEFVLGLAVDDYGRPNAVLELADLANDIGAVVDYPRWLQSGVNNTNVPWIIVHIVHDLAVRLARKVQRQVLLRDQSRAYPRPKMLVQEARHILWTNVFPSLQEASCQYTNSIRVRLHKICHDFCKPDLLLERLYLLFGPW